MIFDILIILLLIGLNGFFSLSEMAVVSSRTARLKELAGAQGRFAAGARAALALKEKPGRFLSTIQIGITLIGVISGAYGGTQLSQPLATVVARVVALAPYAEDIAFSVVVLIITFFTLLIGELIPKNLALSAPERIASNVARLMDGLARLLTPGVWVLDRASAGLLALFGRPAAGTASMTEEEIKHLLEEGAESGAIDDEERDMMLRLINMGDKRARDLMTPRIKMVALDIDADEEVNLARMRTSPATRFPVYQGDPTNIIGVVRVKDLIDELMAPNIDLFRKLHPPVFVSDVTTSNRLLHILQSIDLRMAFVVDEYGTTRGVVTLSDLTRPVTGEMPQGLTGAGASILKRRDGSYLVDGLRPASDLKRRCILTSYRARPGDISHGCWAYHCQPANAANRGRLI